MIYQRGRWLPGGNLLSLLRQKKVGKERRPEVRRPAKARGALRKPLHRFPVQQARPTGRETPATPRNDRPLRNSGSKLCIAKGFYCARAQTVLADDPCRSCVTRRHSSGPGRYITTVALAVAVPRLTLKHLDSRLRGNDEIYLRSSRCDKGPHESRRAAEQTRGMSARTV